ncbi:E3 ubiquitin-protein ligase ZNRF3 [Trichoplax sp. H2]|nr:E3 ubiquitin-protein ligase ZNRF3 [Trichoplax sp. H2]|eukprot:RDD41003.1 E3 ubiquitin-protein ligase ZNRF3 [Trichoplax sp. H2]
MICDKIIFLIFMAMIILPTISCKQFTAATISIKSSPTTNSDPMLTSSKIQGYYSPMGSVLKTVGNLFKVTWSRHGYKNIQLSKDVQNIAYIELPSQKLTTQMLVYMCEMLITNGVAGIIINVGDNEYLTNEIQNTANQFKKPILIVKGYQGNDLSLIYSKLQEKTKSIQVSINRVENPKTEVGKIRKLTNKALNTMKVYKYESALLVKSSLHSLQTLIRSDNSDYSHTTTRVAVDEPTCPICLETFLSGEDIRITPCQHEFHKNCVDLWFEENYTCPLCKSNILEKVFKKLQIEHTTNGVQIHYGDMVYV